MSDTPHPDPLDEQASDLFDAGADAPGDEPELGARLDEFRALRDALTDVPPASDEQRTAALAAALSLFDELAAEADATDGDPDDAPGDTAVAAPAVVTPLGATGRRPAPTRWWARSSTLGLAAAVVVVVGVGLVVRNGVGTNQSAGSAASTAAAGDSSFTAKAATDDNSAGGPESASGGAAAEVSTSVAAGATTAAATAAASTTAASRLTPSSTPAVGSPPVAADADPTSTTDGRDASTIAEAASSTTSPPTTTSTNVDADALAYLGDLTRLDDVAAALRAPPPFDAGDDGAPIRTLLAGGVCDLRPYGTPIAVLRWNGRDSVAMRSADAPIVQLVPLDGCNPIARLDAPS